jgi:hypothetical protein
VQVVQKAQKCRGGLIRADYELSDGRLTGISISGDFFCYPAGQIQRLEADLEGRSVHRVRETLEAFYASPELEIPGVEMGDWLALFGG